jgi:molybdopterin converting factor small subunit
LAEGRYLVKVEVKVLSPLIDSRGGTVEVADGSSGRDVLDALGVEDTEYIMMIVNGRRQGIECELRDGDKIHLLTPVAGG